ncbi:MAG: FliM/FliN family flagellar motor switch protein [Candidatus Ruminococcus intestinipullorum]|nr:FliM/FliN family flagellar motor switch protein [Candidatus Ruminococcus intestinipullorum]
MINTYNFKSPKKFTKERMSIVENLYEGFSRSMATYLTGLLQVYCEVRVSKIEECRYQEYSNTEKDVSFFGLMNLIPENKEYDEAPLIFEMQPSLCFFMIERLLGGQGTEYELDREFTDIEMEILKHLLTQITGYVQEAWNGYMETEAVLTRMETNPHLLQMSAPEDSVIVVEMDVKVLELKTQMYLAMPAANVEELTSKFGFKYVQKRKRAESQTRSRKNLVQNLLEAEVELRAVLQDFELDIQDIVKLQVGDVVSLNKNINSDVEIRIDDVVGFYGRPGQTKLRKAVQIEQVL